jgi:hypothetical protein
MIYVKIVDQFESPFTSGFLCVNELLQVDYQMIANRWFFDIWIMNLDQDWITIFLIFTIQYHHRDSMK